MISNRILQRLQQKLSPQQIQLMKLLQLPTIALEQRIKNEIEQNPTLEEDDSPVEDESIDNIEDNKEGDDEENDVFGDEDMFPNDDDIVSYKNNDGSEKTDKSQLFVSETTFHEDLISQLQLKPLSELEMIIGLEIIGNIDESGYLNRSIESIVDDFLFTILLYLNLCLSMKVIKRYISALFRYLMLSLFVGYYISITMFLHAH
jgi:RNA polymerase sigma-54 factor